MLPASRAQIQRQPAFTKTFQPPFKVPVAIHRLPGHQFDAAARKTLVVDCPIQLAVKPRRGNFQHIRPTRHRVFDVENRPELPTEARAILVRHTARLIDEDAEHAGLARAVKLDLDHLKSARGGHPFRNPAHPIFVKCHESNSLKALCPAAFDRKLKCGLAPTGVLRQMLVLQNSFQYLNIRRLSRKDKPGRGGPGRRVGGEKSSLPPFDAWSSITMPRVAPAPCGAVTLLEVGGLGQFGGDAPSSKGGVLHEAFARASHSKKAPGPWSRLRMAPSASAICHHALTLPTI